MVPGSAFGGEFPAAVALSGLALPPCPLDVTSMGQEAMGGQVEGDEWSEIPPLANLTTSLSCLVSLQNLQIGRPALPNREHTFILRTSRVFMEIGTC